MSYFPFKNFRVSLFSKMSTIKDYNFKGTQTMAGYRIGTNVIGHSERV